MQNNDIENSQRALNQLINEYNQLMPNKCITFASPEQTLKNLSGEHLVRMWAVIWALYQENNECYNGLRQAAKNTNLLGNNQSLRAFFKKQIISCGGKIETGKNVPPRAYLSRDHEGPGFSDDVYLLFSPAPPSSPPPISGFGQCAPCESNTACDTPDLEGAGQCVAHAGCLFLHCTGMCLHAACEAALSVE